MRKLSFLMLVLGFPLPASATERSATIAGSVRNAAGVPQMGAAVEVLGAASQTLRVFTDSKGQYFATGLLPGIYSLKVSAPSFLPTIREKIDLHSGSPTYCGWMGIELSHERRTALLIPAGCAHGFLTLEDEAEVFYMMGEVFHPEAAAGVRWNDPAFGIEWPLAPTTMADRDASWPDFVR